MPAAGAEHLSGGQELALENHPGPGELHNPFPGGTRTWPPSRGPVLQSFHLDTAHCRPQSTPVGTRVDRASCLASHSDCQLQRVCKGKQPVKRAVWAGCGPVEERPGQVPGPGIPQHHSIKHGQTKRPKQWFLVCSAIAVPYSRTFTIP